MRQLLILLLIFYSSFIFSQSMLERVAYGTKSLDWQPLSEERKQELKSVIKKDIQKIKKCTDSRCEVGIYIRMASFHYLLDAPTDTVAFYLNRAKKSDPVRTCGLLNKWVTERGIDKREGMKRDFFAKEFSDKWWNKFKSDCQPILDTLATSSNPKKRKEEIAMNPIFAEELELMNVKDQEYREELMKDKFNDELWEKQRKNDLRNRILLDSLYVIHGFPTVKKVGKKGFQSAWMILQHSTDCSWNEKWIQNYIDHFIKKEIESVYLMPNTMTRFYHPKNGYCPENERWNFIAFLKNKYPKVIAYKFGYEDF